MTLGQGLMLRLGALAWLAVTLAAPAAAQSRHAQGFRADRHAARRRAHGDLFRASRSGVGDLKGVVPDLGRELARRLGVPAQLIRFENPVAVIEAFRKGELDATFIGITADRAAAFDFGPVVLDLQTTYLVPAASHASRASTRSTGRACGCWCRRAAPRRRILKKTLTKATMISVAVENPRAGGRKARGRRGRRLQPRGADAGLGAAHDAGLAHPAGQLLQRADRDRLRQGAAGRGRGFRQRVRRAT